MQYANEIREVRIESIYVYIQAGCVKVVTRRTRRRRNLQCDLAVSFCIGVFSGFLRVKNFSMSFQF